MARRTLPLLSALLLASCSFEVTSQSDPQLLEGNPMCPSAEFLGAIPEELQEYLLAGLGVGIQLGFDAMIGAVEDEMAEEDTGPARHIYPREMRMVQQNTVHDPDLTNTLGFQRGLEIYHVPPVGSYLDTARLAWVDDIYDSAMAIEFEVDPDLDMLPYMDLDSATSSVPTLRTCNRENISYVTISTVEVHL